MVPSPSCPRHGRRTVRDRRSCLASGCRPPKQYYLRGEGGTPTLDFRHRQQARQVARLAARFVHEEMLEHRHMLDRAEHGAEIGKAHFVLQSLMRLSYAAFGLKNK